MGKSVNKNNSKSKKWPIIVIILIILLYALSLVRFDFIDYIQINNYDDLITKVNNNAINSVNTIFEDESKEREYITNLSDSFIIGYSFYSSPFIDDNFVIRDRNQLEILNITNLFMTQGKENVCINTNYFNDMLYSFFRIENMKIEKDVKKYLYDFYRRSYCFKKEESSDINLQLISYHKKDSVITLKYVEDNIDEGEKYEWEIEFLRDEKGYYLNSFSNIVIGSEEF